MTKGTTVHRPSLFSRRGMPRRLKLRLPPLGLADPDRRRKKYDFEIERHRGRLDKKRRLCAPVFSRLFGSKCLLASSGRVPTTGNSLQTQPSVLYPPVLFPSFSPKSIMACGSWPLDIRGDTACKASVVFGGSTASQRHDIKATCVPERSSCARPRPAT